MSAALLTDLTIFILAVLIGIEVIGKVPATLHTPLMSATNAIHGIVLVGALLIGVTAHNVGRVHARVRGRRLRRRERGGRLRGDRADAEDVPQEGPGAGTWLSRRPPGTCLSRRPQGPAGPGGPDRRRQGASHDRIHWRHVGFTGYIQLVYVLAAVLFVVGLHLMNSPATARRGNQVSLAGMVTAGHRHLRPADPLRHGHRDRLDRADRRRADRLRGGPLRRADGEDDRHAAAGLGVQRGRRRRRRAGGHLRLLRSRVQGRRPRQHLGVHRAGRAHRRGDVLRVDHRGRQATGVHPRPADRLHGRPRCSTSRWPWWRSAPARTCSAPPASRCCSSWYSPRWGSGS